MRQLAKDLFRKAGFRLERWRPSNRFDAMADALELLKRQDFHPRVIIDGGANAGNWTRMALHVFPDAAVHLIEPQPACRPALERLARTHAAMTLHPVALSEPGRTRLSFTGGTADGGTGVHVMIAGETDVELECLATTLDGLFATRIERADRPLLKLDVEGHELDALRGARALLDAIEVIIVEVQLYDINDSGVIPVFRDVYDFLAGRGFELYDLASIGWRQRDMRMHMLDPVFVRSDSPLCTDRAGV
jgi:FkbM family methyltransferase